MSKAKSGAPVDTLAIELWAVDRLVPYARNAKKHPDAEIKRLASTIARFGWDQPIVVDRDGVIIKGHGRRLAAIKLGLDKVPVLVRGDLSKDEADAVRISDNAVAGLSYDTKVMEEELNRLMAADDVTFTADDLGLSEKEKDLLLKQIDVANADVLIEDTSAEIAEQQQDEREQVARADQETMPLADAFGFKKIERQHARLVQRLMAAAESETELGGVEALVGWLQSQVAAGAL